LGAAAHFAQTLPDIERDLDQGVQGLPQRLGARVSTAAAGGLLGAGALVMGLGQRGGTPPTVLAIIGVTVALAAAIVVTGTERPRPDGLQAGDARGRSRSRRISYQRRAAALAEAEVDAEKAPPRGASAARCK
jgi:hypothetical protein